MRKIDFISLVLGLIICLPLVSCSKDDEEATPDTYAKKIVGTWKFDYDYYVTSLEDGWNPISGDLCITFNDDGTCSVTGASTVTTTASYAGKEYKTGTFDVDFNPYTKWKCTKPQDSNVDVLLITTYPFDDPGVVYNAWNVTFLSNDVMEWIDSESPNSGYKLSRVKK